MLSPLDDFLVHQAALPIAHPATSDRNFYDRYYFNCHGSDDRLMLIAGMGQYPNLGVADAFVLVRHGDTQQAVRASKELTGDRRDTAVGPIRVEVVEPLRRLRLVCDPNEWGLDCDLWWEGQIPAVEEPHHLWRQHGRVVLDAARLAQTGCWTDHINVAGHRFAVTPDRWRGSRGRSWGIRPVGEPEPPGRSVSEEPVGFFWIYCPMSFEDFSILTIVQEETDGTRVLEEAVRVWPESTGRPLEHLGRSEYELVFAPATRTVERVGGRRHLRHRRPGRAGPVLRRGRRRGPRQGGGWSVRSGRRSGPRAVRVRRHRSPPPDWTTRLVTDPCQCRHKLKTVTS